MSSIADESAAERHVRWSELRAHLRAEGAGNIPPGLLRNPVPNTPTRPEVPLIAYYANVKQVSLGPHTPKDLITVLLAVTGAFGGVGFGVAGVAGLDNQQWMWLDWPWPEWTLALVLGLLGFGVGMLIGKFVLGPLFNTMTTTRGPLGLSCEELKLTLPGRGLHPHWRDVYTATCVRKPRSWRTGFRSRTYVRVELNDGLSSLHVDRDDCAPLARTMRALIVAHRTHTTAPSDT